jgi:hypothetical protein
VYSLTSLLTQNRWKSYSGRENLGYEYFFSFIIVRLLITRNNSGVKGPGFIREIFADMLIWFDSMCNYVEVDFIFQNTDAKYPRLSTEENADDAERRPLEACA